MRQASVIPVFRYRAFISYSHQDKSWAGWLHKALETYAIPKRLIGQTTAAGVIPKRLAPIFRDRDELASATDLGRKVNEALAQSANLIVICSPRSAASHWVNEEVLAFKRLGRSEQIFCLIVDGEPNASALSGRIAEECFAEALRFTIDADGRLTDQPTEPIAADARPGKDGKSNAKLKLIAGMLDIGFDALKRRELQRRARRTAALATLALIVMAVTTTLAVMAVIARNAAVVARNAAEVASQAAVRRQKQAEGLVDFMLGDLNDKLNEVHRLDIMQSVDDKAMAYFVSLPSSDVTDEALTQRVSALEKIGSVRMDQGQIPVALKAYQAASAFAAELTKRSPGNADHRAAYGDSLKWMGQAYLYQGDLDHALQNFKAASTSLQISHAAKPEDTEIAFKFAASQIDTGRVLEKRSQFDAAKTQYLAALNTFEDLHARQPTNTRWQRYLGSSWNDLGKVALERGELHEALTAYRTDQRIKAAMVAQDPSDHRAQADLLMSNAIFGSALSLCGNTEAALRYTNDAVDSAKALIAFDPLNAGWQEYFALYSQHLGGQLRQLGRLDHAAAADSDAVRVLGALAAKDPTNSDYEQELAESQLESARLQLARNDADTAQSLAKLALENILRLRTKKSDNRTLSLLTAQAYTVLGQIAAIRNDSEAARNYWVQARDTIAPIAQSENDPKFLAAWASTLLLLDQTDTAQPAVKKLAAMGYRTPDFVALTTSRQIPYPVDQALSRQFADAVK
jgi:tetratricopeptide (TPR) repeat protein